MIKLKSIGETTDVFADLLPATCHMCGKRTTGEKARLAGWKKNWPRASVGCRVLIWTCCECVSREES